jgi:4-hydroxybenzoate polyprenyltransferase
MNIRALLELCRISNLPTVWSNAVVGVFAGSLIADVDLEIAWFFAPLAAMPISLIYCGGMVLNDLVDRHVDAEERPNRPIPSGRVSISNARVMSLALLGIPVAFIACIEALTQPLDGEVHFAATLTAIVLVMTVVLYNLVHQSQAISVILMGLCRVGVVLCAAALITGNELYQLHDKATYAYGAALTLFIYTLAISIVARNEMQPRWFGGPKTIMNMIAGIPLLDAIWLVVMGLWPASLFCLACAGMTMLAHRKVAGS